MKVVKILHIKQIISNFNFIALLQFFEIQKFLIASMHIKKSTMMLLAREIRFLKRWCKCLLIKELNLMMRTNSNLILHCLHICDSFVIILDLLESLIKIFPHIPRTPNSREVVHFLLLPSISAINQYQCISC